LFVTSYLHSTVFPESDSSIAADDASLNIQSDYQTIDLHASDYYSKDEDEIYCKNIVNDSRKVSQGIIISDTVKTDFIQRIWNGDNILENEELSRTIKSLKPGSVPDIKFFDCIVKKLRAFDNLSCLADMSRGPAIILSSLNLNSLYGLKSQNKADTESFFLQYVTEQASSDIPIDKNIFSRVRIIFLPLYIPESHWLLCVIYPSARRVEIVDSVSDCNTSDYHSHVRSVVLLLLHTQCNLWGVEFLFDAAHWSFEKRAYPGQNYSKTDSAIVTLSNIDSLLNNFDPWCEQSEDILHLRLFYARILCDYKNMPYCIINRTETMDEEQGKVPYEVYKIFQDEHRDQDLEALIVNLYNSNEVNYVYFENMASATTVWNVDIMLKRYR
jgi:Ulp1 protease family, C-terminal catalytic domain